jgi:hypothetical protein
VVGNSEYTWWSHAGFASSYTGYEKTMRFMTGKCQEDHAPLGLPRITVLAAYLLIYSSLSIDSRRSTGERWANRRSYHTGIGSVPADAPRGSWTDDKQRTTIGVPL